MTPKGSSPDLASSASRVVGGAWARGLSLCMFVIVALLPIDLPAFWLGLLSQGVAFAVIFVSITLVTGEGGMIWLCQPTFAAVGAVTMAELVERLGWPVLAAAVVGGLCALVLGVIVGVLTIRLGDLYVALVTLTFGLVMETLVLSQNVFVNDGRGINVAPPQFAVGPSGDDLVRAGHLCRHGPRRAEPATVDNRIGTSRHALEPGRSPHDRDRHLAGEGVGRRVRPRSLRASEARCVAMVLGNSLPSNYSTIGGILWLVVLVVLGIRSIMASLIAGLVFTIVTELAFVYFVAESRRAHPVTVRPGSDAGRQVSRRLVVGPGSSAPGAVAIASRAPLWAETRRPVILEVDNDRRTRQF